MPTKRAGGLIYARPSFLEGMARVFDIGGTLNEYRFSPRRRKRDDSDKGENSDADNGAKFANDAKTDMEALRSDWQAVGDDMRTVMGDYRPTARDGSALEDSLSADDYWEGPSPSPETLKQYNDVLPGSAERIARMAESQAERRIRIENDRIQIEKTVVIGDSRRGYLGIVSAFILSLLIISLGAYSVIWGDAWVGVAVIGINIAGLAGVFVYGTNSRRRERERIAADAEAQLDGGG